MFDIINLSKGLFMISESLNAVAHLLEQYRATIKSANEFDPNQQGYLEHYRDAEFLEKRIKTELYKYVCETIEKQLDDIEKTVREAKNGKDA